MRPKEWKVSSSTYAKATFNPIRSIIENMQIIPNPDKPMIALSIGDPTVFGNLEISPVIKTAVKEIIEKGKHNGYGPSTGFVESREAVAEYCSTPQSKIENKDVILCSGCSCALDISIMGLCSPGSNILVPRPGFPLYQTLAEGIGVKVKHYNLLPHQSWKVDLPMLESLIDEDTSAIIVNNPSNPCGSVFPKAHLEAILDVAQRNKVPLIADEIYDNFVFEGQEFHWMASLTDEVPILSCGGLTKRFLVPGWRMGWICIHDKGGYFDPEVRSGLQRLSQRIIGSNTIIQGALPAILRDTPESFHNNNLNIIQKNANISYSILRETKGLNPIMPQGAMYMMVEINLSQFPAFENDLQMVEKMVSEESVFCLPGKCFNIPNFLRIVLTVPEEQMREACNRIQQFCNRYYQEVEMDYELSISARNDCYDSSTTKDYPNKDIDEVEVCNMKIDMVDAKISHSLASLKRDIVAAEMDGE